MKILIGRACVVLLCVTTLGVTNAVTVPRLTATRIGVSASALQRYASSHSLDDLQAAAEALDGTVDLGAVTPSNFTSTRRALVSAYASVIQAAQAAYDPTFNPNDPKNRLFLTVPQPPGVPHGYPGMDPNDIQDPNLRAQYVSAINANKAKAADWVHYHRVQRIDDNAMAGLEVTLRLLNSVAPQGVGPDFSALDQVLQNAGISGLRRAKIDAAIYSESSPSGTP